MTEQVEVREQIMAAAVRRVGWSPGDVIVQPSEVLGDASCRFYRASNRKLPGAGVLVYAIAADGALHDGRDDDALGELLRTCGGQADAAWWAHAITAFDAASAGRPVFPDDGLAISLVTGAGGTYAAPVLAQTGPSTIAEFFVIRHATEPYRVRATLPSTGPVQIESTAIR